jgi:HTH domain
MAQPRDGRWQKWRRDPEILERLQVLERLRWQRLSGRQLAAALGVAETTIRRDLARLDELWLERTAADQQSHRAEIIAALDDNACRALEAYEWDKQAEAAVLYGDEVTIDGKLRVVYRDKKGAAQFRGSKAQALAERRQAVMAKAKVLGLITDKQEQVGDVLVRVVERESRDR